MKFDFTLAGLLLFTLDWLIRIFFILYIPRKRKPSSAIAWLLVIIVFPGVGIFLFLLIGSPKLSSRRRKKQHYINELIDKVTQTSPNELSELSKEEQTRIQPLASLNRSLAKLPMRAGNSVHVLPEYDKAIADIVAHVNEAKEFVHIEYFIIALDEATQPLFDAMESAVKRGVKVRVMFDSLGSRKYPRVKEMMKLLTQIGVEWHKMLPIKFSWHGYNRVDLRNHRKIVVIDDHTAYIGSQNLIDKTYHRKDDIYYDELVVRMTGPVVRHCDAVFAGDWYAETGERLTKLTDPKQRPLPHKTGDVFAQVVPSGPSYDTDNNARLFAQLIHTAQEKIVIVNPYFVPDESILGAITSAAHRGVDVTIINSEAIDQWMVGHAQRSYYEELIMAGIKIHLYKYPTLLHSKHMTIDDDIAVIGSSNMDIRSFELDLECVLMTYSKSVVTELRKVQQQNLKHTVALELKQWHKRSIYHKFLDSIARLTAALQ
jgi:cardiolipin synthase